MVGCRRAKLFVYLGDTCVEEQCTLGRDALDINDDDINKTRPSNTRAPARWWRSWDSSSILR